MKVWRSYVAIGDSFTEGLSDLDETTGRHVGWADRLAGHLAQHATETGESFSYANLAIRGRKLDDIVGRQLEAAVAMKPELVSIVGGGNDLLRPAVNLERLAERLEQAVITLREAGADVLLATPTDTRDAGVFSALRGRHAVHTANLFTIAQRHDCRVVNLWGMASLRDWRMWADDRIHLTTEGHRRVSQAALQALGLPTEPDWDEPLPAAPPVPRREAAAADLAWARSHAAPWVQRRLRGTSSGDSIVAKHPALALWQAQMGSESASVQATDADPLGEGLDPAEGLDRAERPDLAQSD